MARYQKERFNMWKRVTVVCIVYE